MTTVLRRVVAPTVAALVATSGATLLGAPPARAAARPGYVAIVIQGGGTACVKWRSGLTGDDVLNRVTSVHYRRDGLIDQIGGYPRTPKADEDHYWSYWHDTAGSWTYSTVGASGWTPKAGTVEGWSYVDGSARKPPARTPAGLYKTLCGARDKPAPTSGTGSRPTSPAASRTTAAPRAARPAPSRTSGVGAAHTAVPRSMPTASGSASGSASASSSGSSSGSTVASPRPSTASAAPVAPAGSAAATPAGLPLTVDATPASATSDPGSGGGSVLSLVLVGGLLLVLGVGAAWTVRQRRRPDAGL